MKISSANATLVAAALALVGVVASTALVQWESAKLEDRRARTEIVLEMMRSNDQKQMLQKLQILVASGLLPDEDRTLRHAVTQAPVNTFQVQVPVAVQPIKPSDIPTPPLPLGPRPSNLAAAADVLLADHCAAVAYIIRAAPLLNVSAGLPASQAPRYPECEKR